MTLSGKKILIVDDDYNLGNMVELLMESAGAETARATNGTTGLKLFYQNQPDLVILDVLMPGMNGWEVCQKIRDFSNTPILMLTTMREDRDIIKSLENGADDFLAKPFSPEILKVRVMALLRRADMAANKEEEDTQYYDDGYLSVDLEKRRVFVENEPVKMSATELKLLSYFILNAGHILSYQQILNHVWGTEYRDNTDYVQVYVSHLRRKLEPTPGKPCYFLTEHGIGYRFEKAGSS